MLQQVILAFQWVVFHAGVVISGPVILAQGFQLSPAETGELIRLTFVITGVGSILQVSLGHRNMLVEGPAVPWWAAYLVLVGIAVPAGTTIELARSNIEGAMIVAGAVLFTAGMLGIIRRLRSLFTTRITGVLLTLIAIQISGVGIRGLIQHGMPLFAIGVGVLLVAIFLLTRTKGLLRNTALLLSVVVGWAVSAIFGLAPLDSGGVSGIVALPSIFPWGAPTFDFGNIFTLTLLGLLLVPNQIGSLKAMEHATGETIAIRLYDRGLAASGLTCMLSGVTGGVGTTPFAISAGLVAVTGERKKHGFLIGAGLFVLLGIIPPLGQFFGSIPVSIASAVLLISVSSLAVIGLQNATREHLDPRGSFVVGLGLLVGCGIMFVPGDFWSGAPYWLASVLSNGVITGTVVAILLEQTVLRIPRRPTEDRA